jgi:hypothetical protein
MLLVNRGNFSEVVRIGYLHSAPTFPQLAAALWGVSSKVKDMTTLTQNLAHIKGELNIGNYGMIVNWYVPALFKTQTQT